MSTTLELPPIKFTSSDTDEMIRKMEEENNILNSINEDAEFLVEAEKEMRKNAPEHVIKKRLTSSYEIAAHVGVESAALRKSGIVVPKFTLKDPFSLGKADEIAESDSHLLSPLGPTNPHRRVSLLPFLNPANSHIISPRPPQSKSKSACVGTGFRSSRWDPAADKKKYANLFAEQKQLEETQKTSRVQYESMLTTYFKLQEELKKKLDEDPWEAALSDFEDPIVGQLKRRLSQLVGLAPSDSEGQTAA